MHRPGIIGGRPHHGGASYVGPLDIVPGAVVAYSQRAMTGGSTANAITIRRDSDDTTHTFALINNTVDVAAVTAFLGGANGFVSAWNDQSGNSSDVLQTTSLNQPAWLPARFGTAPGFVFNPDQSTVLGTTGNVSFTGAWTIFCVIAPNLQIPTDSWLMGADYEQEIGASWAFGYDQSSGTDQLIADAADATFANESGGDSAQFAQPTGSNIYEVAWTLGTLSFKINGTTIANADSFDKGSGAPAMLQRLAIGANDVNSSTGFCADTLGEVLIYPSILADPNRLAIRQNIAAYYGIPLP